MAVILRRDFCDLLSLSIRVGADHDTAGIPQSTRAKEKKEFYPALDLGATLKAPSPQHIGLSLPPPGLVVHKTCDSNLVCV